jgi:uncharacterized protein
VNHFKISDNAEAGNGKAELQELVNLVTKRYQTARIICFGSVLDVPERQSCMIKDQNGSSGHYFILIGTKEQYPEHEIQEYVNRCFSGGKVFILAHHIGRIRAAIKAGNRFFTLAVHSGRQLFTADDESEIVFGVNSKNWINTAEKQFQNHLHLAECFFQSAAAQWDNEAFKPCLFLLHQTMEQICIGLIRVFLGYRADYHNIGRLLDLCSCFSREPARIFPRNNEEERRLFQLLYKSYTEARYREEFLVEAGDTRKILNKVDHFLQTMKEVARNHMITLNKNLEGSLTGS